MVFIFIILICLLGFSAYSLINLSKKTEAIQTENHVSVVYAREMTEGLMHLNQQVVGSYLTHNKLDTMLIQRQFDQLDQILQAELHNITEVGEDQLAADIQQGIGNYHRTFSQFLRMPGQAEFLVSIQGQFESLIRQLTLLSQMNEKAIEVKTQDAKDSAKHALTQLTVIGSVCFLLSLAFIYSFAAYFNERFFQLYNGIKEIVASNFGQRLYFDGQDEFYEISLLFNQMASKLEGKQHQEHLLVFDDTEGENNNEELEELKSVMVRMKTLEQQATQVMSKLDKKQRL
jgi:methyl-accepting chemotaxis protein